MQKEKICNTANCIIAQLIAQRLKCCYTTLQNSFFRQKVLILFF